MKARKWGEHGHSRRAFQEALGRGGGWGKRKCGVPGPGSSAWGGDPWGGGAHGGQKAGAHPTGGGCVSGLWEPCGHFPGRGPRGLCAWRVGGVGTLPQLPAVICSQRLKPWVGSWGDGLAQPGGGPVGPRRGKPAADGETAARWASAPSRRPWAAGPHLRLLGGGRGVSYASPGARAPTLLPSYLIRTLREPGRARARPQGPSRPQPPSACPAGLCPL